MIICWFHILCRNKERQKILVTWLNLARVFHSTSQRVFSYETVFVLNLITSLINFSLRPQQRTWNISPGESVEPDKMWAPLGWKPCNRARLFSMGNSYRWGSKMAVGIPPASWVCHRLIVCFAQESVTVFLLSKVSQCLSVHPSLRLRMPLSQFLLYNINLCLSNNPQTPYTASNCSNIYEPHGGDLC